GDRKGRLDRHRQARRRVPRAQGRRSARAVRIPRQRPPGDDGRLCRQDRAEGRQGHDVRLQICRWGKRDAVRRGGEEAATSGSNELIAAKGIDRLAIRAPPISPERKMAPSPAEEGGWKNMDKLNDDG